MSWAGRYGLLWFVIGLFVAAAVPAPDRSVSVGVPPGARLLRLASLGHPTVAASAVWMRTVIAFADGHGPQWVPGAVDAVEDLDPVWPVPAAWGALMLRADGAIEAHIEVLEHAAERFEGEPWFRDALEVGRTLQQVTP